MVQSSIEFFKTLPPKQCCECGTTIDEQAESYSQHCDDCLQDQK